MGDELKRRTLELLTLSRKNGVYNSTLECNPECDVTKCKKVNSEGNEISCFNYKIRCKSILDAVLRDVYGENNQVA